MRASVMNSVWTRRRLLGVGGTALLAAACSRSTSGESSDSGGNAANPDELHLVFSGWILDQNPVINDLIKQYSDENGITVTASSAPEDIQQKVLLEARQGNSTWGGWEGHTAFINTAPMAETDVIDSWDDYLTEDDLNDLSAAAQKEMEYDGKKMHFPYRVSPMVMIYRPSLLEKLGYSEPPDSWDGIFELTEKATKDLSTSGQQMYGITFQTEAWRGLWTVMSTLTPEPYDYDAGLSRLDIPEAEEALTILQKLYTYAPADTNTNAESMTNVFQSGQSVLMLSYILQNQRVKEAVGGDVTIGKLPKTDAAQGTVFWSSGPDILKHYGASEEVAKFWLWLSNQKELYDSMWVKNGSPPNRQSMLAKFEDQKGKDLDPGFWLANEMQQNAKAIPNSLWIPIQGKHIKAQTDALFAGSVQSPAEALQLMQDATADEIEKQQK